MRVSKEYAFQVLSLCTLVELGDKHDVGLFTIAHVGQVHQVRAELGGCCEASYHLNEFRTVMV